MTLHLRDSEARAWHGGVTIWREIPGWYSYMRFQSPYHPGQHVECKETWAWDGWCDRHIYKADLDLPFTEAHMPPSPRWRSPILMPRAAVRRHGIVESVTVIEKDGKWWWEIKVKEKT